MISAHTSVCGCWCVCVRVCVCVVDVGWLKSIRCQFHQHFTKKICTNIFSPKKIKSLNVTREKLRKALLYKIFAHKFLVKLTPGWAQNCHSFFWNHQHQQDIKGLHDFLFSHLSVNMLYMPTFLFVYVSVYLLDYLSLYLYIYLPVELFIILSVRSV